MAQARLTSWAALISKVLSMLELHHRPPGIDVARSLLHDIGYHRNREANRHMYLGTVVRVRNRTMGNYVVVTLGVMLAPEAGRSPSTSSKDVSESLLPLFLLWGKIELIRRLT